MPTKSPQTTTDKYKWIVSMLCISIGLFPAIFKTHQAPLNTYDEARLAVNAQEMLINNDYLVVHYDGEPDMWGTKPSLLAGLQAMSLHLWGQHNVAARFPSFLFTAGLYLLLIWFTYRLGRIHWGWLAILMLATAPGFMNNHGARSGDFEAVLCFWLTAFVFSLYLYLHTNKTNKQTNKQTKHLAVACASLTLACLTKGVAGLLIVPGAIIYLLLSKNLVSVLTDRKVWVGVAGFVLVVGGYYWAREGQNPGYLAAVWANELGGRYGSSLEGHQEPFYYYIRLLTQSYFLPWLLLLTLLYKVWDQQPVLFSYLLTLIGGFVLVLSFAGTKISWYLYPVLPLLALLAAAVFSCLGQCVLSSAFLRKLPATARTWLLLIFVFSLPYTIRLLEIDHTIEKDLRNGKMAYGHYVDRHFAALDTLLLTNIGYNPHVLFQVNRLQAAGKHAERIYPGDPAVAGQQLLVCEAAAWPLLEYSYTVIDTTAYCKLIQVNAAR